MGLTTLGAERATQPVPRRAGQVAAWPRSCRPRGARSTCCPRTASAAPGAARAHATTLLERAGYAPFETPVFEDTEVFARGVGESTDIVQKEMFTFEDKGGRSLTLRPEGTAGVCRAYVEHGMHKLPQPVKLLVLGPVLPPRGAAGRPLPPVHPDRRRGAGLRRPLARRRADPAAGRAARGGRGGEPAAAVQPGQRRHPRAPTATSCATYLRAREAELSDEVRGADRRQPAARVRLRPRGHAGRDGRRAAAARPPRRPTTPSTSPRCARCSTTPGCEYELDPTLVRGLDYYTRTVFEFESPALGAQSGVGGGGRYDGLVEQLGGPADARAWAGPRGSSGSCWPATPAEELALPVVYVAVADAEQRRTAFALARGAARAGACTPRWSRPAAR